MITIRRTALALAALLALPVQAQTEIQWWHSMGGALGEWVNDLAKDFNSSQQDYKVVPTFKGSYDESMTAAIAAFRAVKPPTENSLQGVAFCLNNVSGQLKETGRYREALASALESYQLKLKNKTIAAAEQGLSLQSAADIHYKMDNYRQAADFYERAAVCATYRYSYTTVSPTTLATPTVDQQASLWSVVLGLKYRF